MPNTPLPPIARAAATPPTAAVRDLHNLLTVIGGHAALLVSAGLPGEAAAWAAEIAAATAQAAAVVEGLHAPGGGRRDDAGRPR